MHIELSQWTEAVGWRFGDTPCDRRSVQLVLYFAGPGVLADSTRLNELRSRYPSAKLVGCTTGGEIFDGDVHEGTIAVAAIHFAQTHFTLCTERIEDATNSYETGRRLGTQFPVQGLRGVLVLSDGTRVNGSDLVDGLKEALPNETILTGGLAGDGAAFATTLVGADADPASGVVAAIGFYGDGLTIRHGSFGGWDAFGPERVITRSQGNVLYELDGESALDLYKRYLGDEAKNLPGAALLFPLEIRASHDRETGLVRTVVGIDERTGAMIFAGNVPTGYSAQLMRGDFQHLIDGAGFAARQASGVTAPKLAILISCIGRKLLLGQRVAEEVEAVSDVLGRECRTVGFYSYGEIGPHEFTKSCELHNQTMTITIMDEI